VTIGSDIFLAAGHVEEAPETLGLLAHELTHVARQREPRFVPPVLHAAPSPSDDEEELARTVEARAARAAREQQDDPGPPGRPPTPERSLFDDLAGWAQFDPSASVPTGESEVAVDSEWGGLPAPWEPLPAWVTMPAPSAPPLGAGMAAIGASAPGAPAAAPVAQLAEVGRSLESASQPTSAPSSDSATQPAGEPETDLDQLAQQVYAILKQRLAAERRRSGV
jgi:hypothetical protein